MLNLLNFDLHRLHRYHRVDIPLLSEDIPKCQPLSTYPNTQEKKENKIIRGVQKVELVDKVDTLNSQIHASSATGKVAIPASGNEGPEIHSRARRILLANRIL